MTDPLVEVIPQISDAAVSPGKRPKPFLALLLSLIFTGLGQIYNGGTWKGLVFATAEWILTGLGFFYLMPTFNGLLLFVAISLAFKVYVCFDAFVVAGNQNLNPARSSASTALRFAVAVLIVVVSVFGASSLFNRGSLLYRAFKISSGAMCPTLCEGDRMVADMAAFRGRSPQRGEIVLFRFDTERALHIKRVVAIGGDQVSSSQDRVVVNGNSITHPTSVCDTVAVQTHGPERPPDFAPLRVPANKLFLLGDDEQNSFDSRYYGPVEVSRLRGKPLFLYWSRQRTRIGCAVK